MAAEEEKKRHYPTNDNGSCSGEPLDPRILRARGVSAPAKRVRKGRSRQGLSPSASTRVARFGNIHR
jgi:hypothetical protein